MVDELDNIKKLDPKTRIAKLKEIESARKKEIEEARRMISESEHEMRVEEELKDIPIPQLKAVNIDALFSAEEKQVFKTKHFVSEEPEPAEKPLEQTVQEETPLHKEQAEQAVQYSLPMEELQGMASKLKEVYETGMLSQITGKQHWSDKEYQTITELNKMAQHVHDAIAYEQRFAPSGDEAELIDRAGQLLQQALYKR